MRRSGLIWCVSLAVAGAAGVCAQEGSDILVSRAPDSEALITRRGTILEWRGGEVVLDTVGGPKRIANASIVHYETTWSPAYQQARQLLDRRQIFEAVAWLSRALDEEPRDWARQVVRVDLVRCLSLAGQDLAAAQQFLQLVTEDPQTRFVDAIPLAWGRATQEAPLLAEARRWLGASHPAISLLGASWLLGAPDRQQALQVIEELSRDIDPQVAHLAAAQLWQTQVQSADERAVARWQSQVARMPLAIRAGPHKVLAEGLARLGKADDAVLEYMKIPILHPRDYRLSLAGLEGAATILVSQGNVAAARRLWQEIVRDYPGTSAAHAARQRWEQSQEGSD